MDMKRVLFALSVAAAAGASPAQGQLAGGAADLAGRGSSPASGVRAMRASRVVGAAPAIDGRLDEAAWATADVASGFVQDRPHPGEPASYGTEVRVLYDRDAIYIGARMYDPHPDSIVAKLSRRDHPDVSDLFEVGIDSYHDRRTGFVFGLNPRGVKEDVFLFDDTRSDESWDAVWDGVARVDSLGWTAELRIPLSQIRFNVAAGDGSGKQAWGVDFKRTIARYSEESYWVAPPRDGSKLVSIFGEIRGLSGLASPRRLEVAPYTVGKLTRAPGDAADPFYASSSWAGSAGADLKYGVTSNLTVTATLNPDFGQVEADPSVVNLSAFETFFPEKRPFFLEGADIFRFGTGIGDGGFGNESLFYSRRIGRAPQLDVPDEADYSDPPVAAPILGAAKLSGKTAGGWSIGVLDAVTGRGTAPYVTGSGARGVAPVEPLTNYGVARLIRTSADGQNALGAILTSTNRQLNAASFRDELAGSAYVGGINFRRRFARGTYQLDGWLVGSSIEGSDSAIAQRQRDGVHLFQRPDAAHLTYDPTSTRLRGWAGGGQVARITGAWQWGVIANGRSPGFDSNDLGYQQYADFALGVVFGSWSMLHPRGAFRRIRVNADVLAITNWAGENLGHQLESNLNFDLLNNWGGGISQGREQAALSPWDLRGGPSLRQPGRSRFSAWAYTDSRRPVQADLSVFYARQDGGLGTDVELGPGLTLRTSTRMDLSLSPGFSRHTSAQQYVTTEDGSDGASHYVFAHLSQKTVSVTARLNYTVSPTLSFQLYAQPFTSAGRYSTFREVASPRSPDFAQRFRPYAPAEIAYDPSDEVYRVARGGFSFDRPDFGVREYRSNAVLRWEWRRGSTLYLVWSQGRSDDDGVGRFRLGPDFGNLFRTRATNVLLIKASYWLGS